MKLCPTCKSKYPDDANFCPQETCATPNGPQRLQAADEAKTRFQPSAKIGGGNTGEVWRARDGETGAEVAYKLISADVLPSPAAVARAEREFKQLMRVQSPKIATVVDCGKTADDKLYVAMELCQGESLERVLRGGPMPLDKAKGIVAQIGQALLEAQKAGIVHRDVAPKNVIVSPSGEVKVINFPIAKPVTDKVAGVPAYLSPEQAQGKPVDQRSNTYSLAAILYHLLTGEPPFTAPTPQAILDLHVGSPPLPPSQRRPEANLSPDVDRVILKALDKSSSRRHLTLRLFLTEVDTLSVPIPVAAPAAGGAPKPGEVGFAKTMLFAGGQAEVANLVAKAIAARSGGQVPANGAATGAELPAATAASAPAIPAMAAAPVAAAPRRVTPTQVPIAGNGHGHAGAATAPTIAAPTPAPGALQGAAAEAQAARAAAASQAGQGAGQGGQAGQGAAFRETLWFKKGDVEQMVAEAKAKLAAAGRTGSGEVPVTEDVRPIEDRYVDDGTVTTEDRKKFSLRTGGTATALPTVAADHVPGEQMSEKELVNEIGSGRKTLMLVVAGVVLAAVMLVVVMLMGKSGQSSKAPEPTPTPAAAIAPKPAVAAPVAAPPPAVPDPKPAEVAAAPPEPVAKPAATKAAKKKSRRQRAAEKEKRR